MANAADIREDQIAAMHDWLLDEGFCSNGRDQDIVDSIQEEYPGGVAEFLWNHG